MQHSVRSVSLASDRGPARRSSRHSAAAEPAEQAPARGPGRGRSGRYFTVEEPPPLEAPRGIAEITGWELAAAMWRDHLPEQLLGVDCASCKQSWPCDAWEIADGLITQCCDSAGEVARQT
ncbi:hypothetical protein [Glycomyces salinus]|uniref:hypothetical protein n=1 Tax=Glycomyces salinus TaxID=980294 RepID=UPI0018EDFBB9|nr:hypothetical protein [Glycomyces salinus]